MTQSAEIRPDPSLHRKAAIVRGGAFEHTGSVRIEPIPDFDLDRTIFQTLEGRAARFVMKTRVGKEVHWDTRAATTVQSGYDAARAEHILPTIRPELLQFMVEECDFNVEHADGSFLDHLYFGFEYCVQHFPRHAPIVMLLHSILGTGTNTFAMTADKIPALQALMTPEEWTHTEAFPSVLRLLYPPALRAELWANAHRVEALESIRFHRVIDNEPIEMSGADFWIQLNYQLIHLIDFLPVANWVANQNETSFIVFRDLYALLEKVGQRSAQIAYTPASGARGRVGEAGLSSWLTTLIPVGLSEKMAAKSIERFSGRIGHSLDYQIRWG
ncbi:MAG: hypothetical protein ACI8RZ_000140 [Myxococcota bacterium]|jgi:hypothetical protein